MRSKRRDPPRTSPNRPTMRSCAVSLPAPTSAAKSTGRSRREKNSASRATASVSSSRKNRRLPRKTRVPMPITEKICSWKNQGEVPSRVGPNAIAEEVTIPTMIEPGAAHRGVRPTKSPQNNGTATGAITRAIKSSNSLNTLPLPNRTSPSAQRMTATAQPKLTSRARISRGRPSRGTRPRRRQTAG